MKKILATPIILIFLLACSLPSAAVTELAKTAPPLAQQPATDTPTPTVVPATETPTIKPPTATNTSTAIPVVESLEAKVTSDLLSCRYGPGAEYLYLYGLRKTANIELIGRTDGNNWLMVKGKSLCWVNAKFLEITGDPQTLKVLYPVGYKLPVSPYYSAPIVISAIRDKNNSSKVTVKWTDVELRAGDEEDADMFIYIIEIWRCEGGKMIFDPLASNYPEVSFVDEAGCDVASHGRVYFQEKHGFAGPAEILPLPGQ